MSETHARPRWRWAAVAAVGLGAIVASVVAIQRDDSAPASDLYRDAKGNCIAQPNDVAPRDPNQDCLRVDDEGETFPNDVVIDIN